MFPIVLPRASLPSHSSLHTHPRATLPAARLRPIAFQPALRTCRPFSLTPPASFLLLLPPRRHPTAVD